MVRYTTEDKCKSVKPKCKGCSSGGTGQQGADGLSAYDLWLLAGNQGSVEDFLLSLKGEKGDTGNDGARGTRGAKGDSGLSAYQVWLNEGNTGSVQDFLASLKGEQGDTGAKGDPLSIERVYPSVEAMEADTSNDTGTLVIIQSNENDPDNAKLFVKTDTGYGFLTDLSGADGITGTKGDAGEKGDTGEAGKSAYQVWLDLGNAGSEQDFINSLKGDKGDKGEKGDVTDIGTNALIKSIIPLTNSQVPPNSANTEYRTLTWNSKTELGFLHLDIKPTANTGNGVVIGQIPSGVPRPVTLIEQSVVGRGADGTGQIYVTTAGQIAVNSLKAGTRYIVDLTGYYK